jgi:hypothetical protein
MSGWDFDYIRRSTLRRVSKSAEERIRSQNAGEIRYRQPDPLCKTCQLSGVWGHLTGSQVRKPEEWILDFVVEPGHDPERANCSFCRLVFDSLPVSAFDEQHRWQYAAQEGAGPKSYVSLRPLVRKIGPYYFTSFCVVYNYRFFTSLSSMVMQNYRLELALNSTLRRQTNVLGVKPITGITQLDARLLKKWTTRCVDHHCKCRHARETVEFDRIRTLVIDVREQCLVQADTSVPYTALSYMWGQVSGPFLFTTLLNKYQLMEPGALGPGSQYWSQIPHVITDTLALTESMQIPYAWVDCLCIVQDDTATKKEQIMNMDVIYSHAMLTIVLYAGSGATDNLPGVLPSTRALSESTVDHTLESRDNDNMVLTSVPIWWSLNMESMYETRGWTMQEKALSIRVVFLSRWTMWFQCLESRFSDTAPGELQLEPTDCDYAPVMSLEPVKEENNHSSNPASSHLMSYALHVEWFSSRSLTYQSDRLHAFQGILHRLEAVSKQEFLWGHPLGPKFFFSFLWVSTNVDRSPTSKYALGDIVAEDYQPDRIRDFPTWSWLGWTGSVTFSFATELEQSCPVMDFDEDVEVLVQPYFVPDDDKADQARERLAPELFFRMWNRGVLEFTAPIIPGRDISCRTFTGLRIDKLDNTISANPMASKLYPYFKPPIEIPGQRWSTEDEMDCEPIGILFGLPFWFERDRDTTYLVKLKTIPVEENHGSLRALFAPPKDRSPNLYYLFNGEEQGEGLVIAMMIYLTGVWAERKGIAIVQQSFWDSCAVEQSEFKLL